MRRLRPLGDLPESIGYERRAGRVFDPSAGLALDWSNRYQTLQFGLTVNGSQVALQGNGLRTYLYVGNKSAATDLFIAFDTEANAFDGALILPRGFAELIGGEQGGAFCPKSTVNLFSTAAVNAVIIEGTLQPHEYEEY